MSNKPLKVCANCEAYRHIAVKLCSICGYEFPTKPKKPVTKRDVSKYIKRKARIRDAKYPDGKPWELLKVAKVKPVRKSKNKPASVFDVLYFATNVTPKHDAELKKAAILLKRKRR